ncbi:LacI family DNA-binding transcriptional regulator [Capnocytophaga cynodegmi]|uniref:HTH-type transcriptional repressor cytR n=1 Tax=Capnocytophaga cynodegmi TaxID=28189 RepID=A0A0B7HCC4_9FLAO|nr:LacI family DNA-binding transcriptional regulator [Capnocytophaga cynodegmi]CEN36965.1 HTH-type transcriptional repressor cytR [Capnocytophaga cynodegmi]
MKRKITIKDIAKELDVSVSTVSKAINNSSEISEETKQRVRALVELHDYRPNSIALSLKSKKSKTIAIVIPEIAHDFFSMVVKGIESVTNEKGYKIVACFSNELLEQEVKNIETLVQTGVDGFIVALSKETQQKKDYRHLREVLNQEISLVLIDRVAQDIYCDKVIVDDAMASYKAVNHLINSGYHRIGILTVPDYISVGNLRTQGYKNALQDANIQVDENLILAIEDIHSDEVISNFFDAHQFDALLCSNEFLAVKALRQAHDRKIKVPEELGIVTFADGFLAKNSYPKLTAIDQHGIEIGKKAAELLIERTESKDKERNYRTEIIKTSLVVRESTK